ncbi:MAG: 30S ribosome-binding factor RbfA [Dehalococcoidales bacterium]|nr:30S ribosome-binding factor RbfA [Dehalococcoidales bacterium]
MSYRIERVNQLIRQEISDLLLRQIKDPRLGNFLSVNEVETAADLKHAKVYVSCICTEEEKKEIISTLESASGYLHNELTKRIRMRYVPSLSFYWDNSIERASHIINLIDRVSKPEEQV